LQGLWLIYVPTGTLAAAMRAAGRSTTLATLVASGSGGGDASLWLAAHTAPLTVASVNADGTLRMLGSNRGFLHPLTTLEKRQDWQENVLPMDQALATDRCHPLFHLALGATWEPDSFRKGGVADGA